MIRRRKWVYLSLVGEWILLAEDSDDDLALALRAIRRAGLTHRIVVARDGKEALEVLGLTGADRTEPESPELVLLDIKMPLHTGLDVLREMRKCPRFKGVPVVMLSSSDEPRDLREAYELGANSYTVKPVSYEEFNHQLCATVKYWTEINRVPNSTAIPAISL
ncbi:response regulator [soil metagenome]